MQFLWVKKLSLLDDEAEFDENIIHNRWKVYSIIKKERTEKKLKFQMNQLNLFHSIFTSIV